jgi:hypothetical protein
MNFVSQERRQRIWRWVMNLYWVLSGHTFGCLLLTKNQQNHETHISMCVLVHIWQNGFTECTYVRDGYFGQFQRNKSRNSHPHILVIYPEFMNFTYIICFLLLF